MVEPMKDLNLLSSLMRVLVKTYGVRRVLVELRDLYEEETDTEDDGPVEEEVKDKQLEREDGPKRKKRVHLVQPATSSDSEDNANGGGAASNGAGDNAKTAKGGPAKKTRGKRGGKKK